MGEEPTENAERLSSAFLDMTATLAGVVVLPVCSRQIHLVVQRERFPWPSLDFLSPFLSSLLGTKFPSSLMVSQVVLSVGPLVPYNALMTRYPGDFCAAAAMGKKLICSNLNISYYSACRVAFLAFIYRPFTGCE